MYLSIPDSFLVPVRYAEDDFLDIKKIIRLKEGYDNSSFINKVVNRKDVVVGVSLPTQREERWVRDKEAMEAYIKEKGVILKIEINDYDVDKQASQVENLIAQGIDVLILIPLNESSAISLFEKAHKAGVKVISYETLIKNSDLDAYIGFNNIRIGQLQGRFLVTKVPTGNYIIMSGGLDTLFKEGAMEYIKPLVNTGNINIVVDKAIKDWDPKIAFKVVKDALIASNNKIDAILAPNDAIAGVAIAALQEQGLAGKVAVTGQDAELSALQRIIQGTQSMTIFKDTRELAKKAIDVAIKLGNGEPLITDIQLYNGKVYVPSVLLTPVVIDRNNIGTVPIESGYLKKEDIYKIQ